MRFTFAADGIALVMLMLIAVLVPLVILASWHDAEQSKRGPCRPTSPCCWPSSAR